MEILEHMVGGKYVSDDGGYTKKLVGARVGGYYAERAYDYRDELKAAGFRWNPDLGIWLTLSINNALKLHEHIEPDLLARMRQEVIGAAENQAQQDAALPLLKPSCKLASTLVVDVSVRNDAVEMKLTERNEAFRELVKHAGFSWESDRWQRKMNCWTGTPEDRAADIAQQLIEAGFVVRVTDAGAHAKAVSGEFTEEQTKWISTLAGGEHKGWLVVWWGHDDDMFSVANTLPGSRYKPYRSVICPPDTVIEVLDFAAIYGFQASPGAMELLAKKERELSRGLVVSIKKKPKKEVKKLPIGMPKLKAIAGEIDDDLLDND